MARGMSEQDSNNPPEAAAKTTREPPAAPGGRDDMFRILVQGVTEYAIYMLDPDGNISNWNLGGERIKGYSEAEIVGRHFSVFYTEEDQARGEPARTLA